ncbi:MAG: LamG domain-containing protein [Methylococcaceae bacterium]
MKSIIRIFLFVLGSLIHLPALANLNDGLVAYYPFNGNANDESGNNLNGIENGTINYVQGKLGQALQFDGISTYINSGNSSLFNVNQHSIIAWINYKQLSDYKVIVGKVNPYIYEAIGLGIGPDGTLDTGFATDNEVNHLLISNIIPSNQWHFVVMTYDGAFVRFYIDGTFTNSYPRTGIVRVNTNNLTIGRHGGDNRAADAFFNGLIDEARIYNRALTDTEIQELYGQGIKPTITSITPTIAILNQQTTFTVTGTNLSDNMGFTIGDCDSNNQPIEIGNGTNTQRQYQCTPRGTAGEKIGYIKTKAQGERLLSFTTKIQATENLPIIIDVNPKTALLNKPTEFTITGGNLTANMGFTIADCDASNNEVITKITAISRTFMCTPRGTIGRKAGIIKTAPQELALHYFDVQIKTPKTAKIAKEKTGTLINQSEVKTINLKDLIAINDTTLTVNTRLKSQIALWKLPSIIKIGSIMRKVESYVKTTQGIILTVSIPNEEEWLKQLNFDGKAILTSSALPQEDKEANPTLKIKALRQSELNPHIKKSITITDDKNIFKFSFTNHILYDADGDTSTKLDQLLVNGDITLDKPTVTFNYSKSIIPLQIHTSVKYFAGESFNLLYNSPELKFQLTNAQQPIKLGTFIFPIPVTSGAVYGNLTLYLVFDINGQAKISANFNQYAKADLGFSIDANSTNVIFDKYNKSSAKLVKPVLTATGEFNASLMLNSALKFLVLNYDLTGINAGVGPAFNIKETVTPKQSCLETSFNFNANASAYMMLPHVEVKETYWGWYSFEASMLKNTYQVFDGVIGSFKPFSLNGCTP